MYILSVEKRPSKLDKVLSFYLEKDEDGDILFNVSDGEGRETTIAHFDCEDEKLFLWILPSDTDLPTDGKNHIAHSAF